MDGGIEGYIRQSYIHVASEDSFPCIYATRITGVYGSCLCIMEMTEMSQLDTYMCPAYIFRNDLRKICVIAIRCISHVSVIRLVLLNDDYSLVGSSVNQ